MSELKACPFCGDRPRYWFDGEDHIVACINVECGGSPSCVCNASKDEASAKWNRRASPATPAEDARDGERDAVPVMPEQASEAMLRPFYECPPDELPLAYQAMRQIALVEQRRAALATQGEK